MAVAVKTERVDQPAMLALLPLFFFFSLCGIAREFRAERLRASRLSTRFFSA